MKCNQLVLLSLVFTSETPRFNPCIDKSVLHFWKTYKMKMTVELLLIPLIYLFLWYKNYNYCIRFMNYQYFLCYMKTLMDFQCLKSWSLIFIFIFLDSMLSSRYSLKLNETINKNIFLYKVYAFIVSNRNFFGLAIVIRSKWMIL